MTDLQAFYRELYTVEDPERAQFLGRWQALGAANKAAHIPKLCRDWRPARVVEISCGDAALAERKVGETLDGFELSAEAAALAKRKAIANVGRIESYDELHVAAEDNAYDLAVLSHVVEHVPEPAPLLAEAARLAPRVIVEVPLEANRSAKRPAVRAEPGRIGHVHAFDRDAVRALMNGAGLPVVAEFTDPLSLAHQSYLADSARGRATAAARTFVRRALFRAFPAQVERLFTAHFACLAARAG